MVLADGLGYSELFEVLTNAEEILGRNVNPTLYSIEDFQKKLRGDNHFVTRVIRPSSMACFGQRGATPAGSRSQARRPSACRLLNGLSCSYNIG